LQAKVSLPELINPHVLRAKIMAKKKLENLSFEESLNELDTIVQSLEQGELSLEESMALFERGLNLSQLSQVKLQAAEQKVQILLEKNGTAKLSDFDSSAGES
jgi:exodeoxyribonuclease VII small subunit